MRRQTVPLRAYEGRYFSDTAGPLNLVLADDGSRLTLETSAPAATA